MACCGNFVPVTTRRRMLQDLACGFGSLALAGVMNEQSAAASVMAAKASHIAPRAKRVIFLFMAGGVSHVDSFDYKPTLDREDGKMRDFDDARSLAKRGKGTEARVMKSLWKFRQRGATGKWTSDLFPEMAGCVDDLCFLHGMHTEGVAHGPATLFLHTGSTNLIRPSMGSWISYGLGTENENLPAFVVLSPAAANGGPRNYGCAFLPAVHQGTFIPSKVERPDQIVGKDFDPKKLVSFITNKEFTLQEQRRELDLLKSLDGLAGAPQDPQLDAAISAMETAYRMQTEAPDVFDIRKETKATLELYGPGSTARGCLMAVRLVERGVRMVQVYYAKGDPWDAHSDIQQHRKNAKDSDQPFAAVIKDLKSRGLFDETIVVCGSEFGRTPVVEVGGMATAQSGRDHNPFGFSVWVAGGGFKGGMTYGATDDFGFKAIDKPVHVHDLHATILHQLGIDHTKLTYRYSGRDFRLTDVSGTVLHDILA